MHSLITQFNRYQKSNMDFISVPCLVFALMIFTGWIHIAVPKIFDISLTWPLLIALLVYYYRLDVLLAAGLTVIFILMAVLSQFISQPSINWSGFLVFLFFFVIGICLQWLVHHDKKKKLALTDKLSQALIAPMFLFAELMFAIGYREDLQEKMKK